MTDGDAIEIEKGRSMSVKRWDTATEKYVEAKRADFLKKQNCKRCSKSAKEVPTIEEFMNSKEGESAQRLLRASGRKIVLGGVHGREFVGSCFFKHTMLFLDDRGFATYAGGAGVSSLFNFKKLEPAVERISVEAITQGCLDKELFNNVEGDLVTWLRKRLDAIASSAP